MPLWTVIFGPKFKFSLGAVDSKIQIVKVKYWILVSTLPRHNIMDSGFQSQSSIFPCGHSKLTNSEDRPTYQTLVPSMMETGVHSITMLVSLLWTPR